nr:hypothetical protein GCM10025732_43990 [Glycomyces mayteni]
MIPLDLRAIAAVTGGTVAGDPAVTVTAPAVLDGREAEPGGLLVAFAGEHADGHDFAAQAGAAGAAAVLGTRPTALPTVVVADAQAALQALAAHVAAVLRGGLTITGVTGSQGKTGTKDLIAAVLGAAAPTVATTGSLNNELGTPITMLRADPATRFLVLEMGARRVGDIAALAALAPPDIGVVLNVGQAHLSYMRTREAIATAKGELVQGLAPGGTAVLNADDPRTRAMRALAAGPVLTFGTAADADVRVADLTLDRLGRPAFTLRTADGSARVALPVTGAHQAGNAAAAAAAGLAAGVPSTRPRRPWRPPRSLSGAWNCANSPTAWSCSTTPTTPTRTRPAPPSTRWRPSKAAAASRSSARWPNSATPPTPNTAPSAPTPPPAPMQ